jgi:DNA modification methylase
MSEVDLGKWLGKVTCGDCLEILRELPDCSVDSVITDPPYELGFMGKSWDAQGISFRTDVWAECLRVAKPGATLLAFGGTRTYHRIAVAIEDAGWYIADSIHWVYGTGFPKSLNIGKAIDKAAGAEREVVGPNENARPNSGRTGGIMGEAIGAVFNTELTAPATDLAREWEGWGTALKPSHEPIIVARKPCEGSFAANAEAWGVAGLNVDGCRVAAGGDVCGASGRWGMKPEAGWNQNSVKSETTDAYEHTRGRYPANLILSHSPGCVCVGEERVAGNQLKPYVRNTTPPGYELGMAKAGRMATSYGHADADGLETVAKWECVDGCPVASLNTQADGTARFFPQFDAEPFLYCAKASRAERERGLEEFEEQEVKHAGQALTNGSGNLTNGTGRETPTRNPHPTVKPLALMQWLCRLTKTPTGGIVLDPFGGSGTTAVAALLEGREFILIEQSPEYVDIACARIADAIRNNQPQLPIPVYDCSSCGKEWSIVDGEVREVTDGCPATDAKDESGK